MSIKSQLEYWKTLLDNLDKEWSKKKYDRDAFVELSVKTLEKININFNLQEIFEIQLEKKVCDQRLELFGFGNYPITLINNGHFFLEILIWGFKDVHIHDHNFVGAFKAIHQRTHQGLYEYKEERKINDRVSFGEVKLLKQKELSLNEIIPITYGSNFLHSSLHLDPMSATIALRTFSDETSLNDYFIGGAQYKTQWINELKYRVYDGLHFAYQNLPTKQFKNLLKNTLTNFTDGEIYFFSIYKPLALNDPQVYKIILDRLKNEEDFEKFLWLNQENIKAMENIKQKILLVS